MLAVVLGFALIALVLYLQISRGLYRTVKRNADEIKSERELQSGEHALESDFQSWEAAFREEFRAHLATLSCNKDVFGFVVEPSEDLGNLHFISCIGRESSLNISDSLTHRFTHVEWAGFLPQKDFDKSLGLLEAIGKRYHDLLIESSNFSNDTKIGASFRERWYSAILNVMRDCDRHGEFGNIWFKTISFSDFSHSIQVRSFCSLNCNTAFITKCSWLVLKRLVFLTGKMIKWALGRLLKIAGKEQPG